MAMLNGYKLKGPCDQCPFRSDGKGVRHLRPGRLLDLKEVSDFSCHKTVKYDSADPERDALTCGGWLAMQWRCERSFPKLTALAASLGAFQPEDLRTDEVFDSWQSADDHQNDEIKCSGE